MSITPKYRICIAGSRDAKIEYEAFECRMWELINMTLEKGHEPVFLHGACKTGPDAMCAQFAADNEMEVEEHPADWTRNGKAAGPMRNKQMARDCNVLIAFWDTQSKGTLNMIQEAKAAGKIIKIIVV